MKTRHNSKSKAFRDIAMDHIMNLFRQANIRFNEDSKLSHRYIKMAREIAMHYKIKLPKELKRKVCKHCHHYIVPGRNCRVRTQHGKVVYSCLDCKGLMRFPYLKEQKVRRKNNA